MHPRRDQAQKPTKCILILGEAFLRKYPHLVSFQPSLKNNLPCHQKAGQQSKGLAWFKGKKKKKSIRKRTWSTEGPILTILRLLATRPELSSWMGSRMKESATRPWGKGKKSVVGVNKEKMDLAKFR